MPWWEKADVLRRGEKSLGLRERAIMLYIAQHQPCTVREIGAGVGLRSSSTVHEHLTWLRHNGLIQFEHAKSRTINLYPDVMVSQKGLVGWWLRYPEGEP